MQPFIQRIIIEYLELVEKRDKLSNYLSSGHLSTMLYVRERILMADQLDVMRSYIEILEDRIEYYSERYKPLSSYDKQSI